MDEKPVFVKLDPPESSRVYDFGNGKTVTIQNVTAICVRPSGTHRLETADGTKWIIPPGWIAISFKAEGWMVRLIRKRLPEVAMLVSYSDPDTHDGTIYRACGWTEGETTTRKGPGRKNWHNRERQRTARNEPCERVTRWTKEINRG